MNPAGLPPGQYYGSINVAARDAVNSSQSVSILLNVAAPGQTGAIVGFSTGGVILSGSAGSTAPQRQPINLFNPTNSTINYSTAASTSNGIAWLSASPASGPLLPGSSSLSITANLSALPPGVQTGTVTVAFDNGTVGIIQVAVIATSGTPGSSVAGSAFSARASAPSSACAGGKPGYLVPIFRQPLSHADRQEHHVERRKLVTVEM